MRFLQDMLLRPSRQVITAGKADERVADGGGPIPDHSVFTGHFLDDVSMTKRIHSSLGYRTPVEFEVAYAH